MINTNKMTWESVYAIGVAKNDTKFLEYLACTEDDNMIKNYLRYTFNFKEENQYLLNSFLSIITKHAKNSTILLFIFNHFWDTKPKHVDITAALIIIINNVYSVNLLTKEINTHVKWLKIYAKILFDEIKEMDSIMLKSDKAESKISIRKNQIERQRQYHRFFFV
ncbi:uncharacterized protein LOC114928804 [Nylanderia fulva]|uniref:uncharacterized protein LOC114928804 n=1 Tax=Nylanderia fulva TaxID=613905 RepID=UPI0010FBA8E4|nr:uncharacterized protein LOC114928804 [Nylanderia fulva]